MITEDPYLYGMIYGMKRTTVYFPDEMKVGIEIEAARRRVTEAEVIRSAVERELAEVPDRRQITPAIPEGLPREIGTEIAELLDDLESDSTGEA